MKLASLETGAGISNIQIQSFHSLTAYVLDEENELKRRNGQPFEFFGGYFPKQTANISIRSDKPTHWTVIVNECPLLSQI